MFTPLQWYYIFLAPTALLADVHLKWKDISEQSQEQKISVSNTNKETDDSKFSACVAEFALVLRKSQYAKNASTRLQQLQTYLAKDAYKAEFAELVTLAIQSEKY